jgi:hypothetical protein
MLVEGRLAQHTYHPLDSQAWAARQALALYRRLYCRAWLRQVWSALTGRTHRLLDLASFQAKCTVPDHGYAGTQSVPLSRIRGSSSHSRCHDFDADFRPLNPHNQARWLRLAVARQRGAKLPPVALIKVEQIYFVEDGHHRVSLAQALGEHEIEAEVTIWQMAEPSPC